MTGKIVNNTCNGSETSTTKTNVCVCGTTIARKNTTRSTKITLPRSGNASRYPCDNYRCKMKSNRFMTSYIFCRTTIAERDGRGYPPVLLSDQSFCQTAFGPIIPCMCVCVRSTHSKVNVALSSLSRLLGR